jgi:7-carboxy-7-deazaguanine synthase
MTKRTLSITEIFHSIQGESTWTGIPCSFVRLAGCNLRCTWCDTTYSFTGGTQMTVAEIIADVARADLPIVEVTGGEPLLQKAVYPLLDALLAREKPVLLETSGALTIADVPEQVHRIVDMKAPGSGEEDKNHYPNLDLLTARDELKIVVLDRRDYEWSWELMSRYEVMDRVRAVTLQPVADRLDPAMLASWIIADHLPVRLGVQLHKVIWPDAEKGR